MSDWGITGYMRYKISSWKEKNELDFIKNKNIYFSNDNVKNIKRHFKNQKKIFKCIFLTKHLYLKC